jgi:hypothetical protein
MHQILCLCAVPWHKCRDGTALIGCCMARNFMQAEVNVGLAEQLEVARESQRIAEALAASRGAEAATLRKRCTEAEAGRAAAEAAAAQGEVLRRKLHNTILVRLIIPLFGMLPAWFGRGVQEACMSTTLYCLCHYVNQFWAGDAQTLKGNIRVFCRVRPVRPDRPEVERLEDGQPVLAFPAAAGLRACAMHRWRCCSMDTVSEQENAMLSLCPAGDSLERGLEIATARGGRAAFTFDQVFGPAATQVCFVCAAPVCKHGWPLPAAQTVNPQP